MTSLSTLYPKMDIQNFDPILVRKKRYLDIDIYVMIKLKFIINLFYLELRKWSEAASYALNR
jgi:hypothetical protein